MLIFPIAAAQKFNFGAGEAVLIKPEALGTASGDIDDAPFDVRTSIGDSEDLRMAIT